MHLTPEQKAIGKENFNAAIGSEFTRRDFLKSTIAAGVVSGAGLGAMYFGYGGVTTSPLRVGFIGTGDEGNVLIGALTPGYIQVVAIADIRPYNVHRAFHGDWSSDNALKVRPGLMSKYGWTTEDEAKRHVKVYDKDYHDLLNDPDVEAVVIALPLHLHAPVAIEAILKGKHVLTEKLMAHSVHECKEMARIAKEKNRILVVGHQRHYSILYDNAIDTIHNGLIGEIHAIRAQWHRENLPGHDSWQPPLPGDEKLAKDLAKLKADMAKAKGKDAETIPKRIAQLTAQCADAALDAKAHGYRDFKIGDHDFTAMRELIQWRLFNRTGGGLMAELGSHQLDASGIFISGLRKDGQKALPMSVSAVGGRNLFPQDRECEDHVYCIYEFPGPDFESNPNNVIGVTYSSINGNGFGGYGETVLGTKGTLILEREEQVMLFKGSATSTSVGVVKNDKDKPTLDTTQSGGGEAAAIGKLALGEGPPSRGYTEELEHWAYCIKNPDSGSIPRCHPKVAMGDAIIALVTNKAIQEKRRIEFEHDWFDIDSDETPEGIKPDVSKYA